MLPNWFVNRRWYVQLGIAVLLLAAIGATALFGLPREVSVAATNGTMLSYDLGSNLQPDEVQAKAQSIADLVKPLTQAYKDSHADAPDKLVRIAIEARSSQTVTRSGDADAAAGAETSAGPETLQATLNLALAVDDPALVQQIKDARRRPGPGCAAGSAEHLVR